MSDQILYTPEDLADIDYPADVGYPGEFPYTRGIYPTMYRGRLWTMRQFAGFGLPDDTNRRFRKLWAEGETGFSTAFDLPTLLGYDSDSPYSLGEVGKGGVAIDTLEDMTRLFAGIPIGKPGVSVSMTINAPAPVLLAMYYALGKRKRADPRLLRGTIQNDILKEFTAQNELIVAHEPAMKLFVDTVEFCTKHMPNYNPVSISGYHIREKGATAVQELAFTLADGIAYVQACIERGLDADEFAPRFSFFFDIHNNFFEEIAKLRAARRMWARIMRERFNAKNPRSWMLRTHAQTAGVSLTWEQRQNNIMRAAVQALAGALAGVQSLHVDAYDEQDSLPSEDAALLALRTQQIIAYESGVCDVVDPLGGSYYIERLTQDMEEQALEYIKRIDEMGGMVAAVELNFPKSEIEMSAFEYEKKVHSGEIPIVGRNKFQKEGEEQIVEFRGNKRAEKIQCARLTRFRARRNCGNAMKALDLVKEAAEKGENVMPSIVSAVEACATEGEIVQALQEVYGEYRGGE
ncbi:MAG: methylmalonyl-CoA mutase [Candidatus Spechtbacteria bacterium]|nr:methylmalonyl-CoA mutase [Candidatus Spechtbacteria bacterium]